MYIFSRMTCSGGFQTSAVPPADEEATGSFPGGELSRELPLGLSCVLPPAVRPGPPGPGPLDTAWPDMTPHLNLTVKLNLVS